MKNNSDRIWNILLLVEMVILTIFFSTVESFIFVIWAYGKISTPVALINGIGWLIVYVPLVAMALAAYCKEGEE